MRDAKPIFRGWASGRMPCFSVSPLQRIADAQPGPRVQHQRPSTTKRSSTFATPALPVTCAVPDRSTSGGDQQGFEQFHFANAEHIPGDDPDEDTDAFGNRDRDGRDSQNLQLPAGACCSVSLQATALASCSMPTWHAQTASQAKKCWRVAAKNCSQLSFISIIWSSFSVIQEQPPMIVMRSRLVCSHCVSFQ